MHFYAGAHNGGIDIEKEKKRKKEKDSIPRVDDRVGGCVRELRPEGQNERGMREKEKERI